MDRKLKTVYLADVAAFGLFLFGHSVNRRRFKCEKCQKPFSESLDFVPKKKSFTHRYAESITQQVVHSDIKNVANNNGLTSEEVESMVIYFTKFMLHIDLSNLRKLGIDEIRATNLSRDS